MILYRANNGEPPQPAQEGFKNAVSGSPWLNAAIAFPRPLCHLLAT